MRNKIYNRQWHQKKTFGKPNACPKETALWAGRFRGNPNLQPRRAVWNKSTACSLIGSPESVEFQLKQLRERVHFDEIMAVSYIFDEQKQAQSYTMLKAIVDKQ